MIQRTIPNRTAYLIYVLTLSLVFSGAARVMAGTATGSFDAPLNSTLGGTGVSNPTAHGVLVGEGASAVTPLSVGTNGQVLVGSTGADPVFATLGTGTGIGTSTGAGTLTINNTGVTSVSAGAGISLGATTGACSITNTLATRTITAKTGNYSVLSGDTSTVFTNTGAAGEVDFTLPTAAAGLTYVIYTDAAQVVKVIAGSSTTIRLGGSVSASAGNITNSTIGGCVTLVAISTTQWIALGLTGSWTVT